MPNRFQRLAPDALHFLKFQKSAHVYIWILGVHCLRLEILNGWRQIRPGCGRRAGKQGRQLIDRLTHYLAYLMLNRLELSLCMPPDLHLHPLIVLLSERLGEG